MLSEAKKNALMSLLRDSLAAWTVSLTGSIPVAIIALTYAYLYAVQAREDVVSSVQTLVSRYFLYWAAFAILLAFGAAYMKLYDRFRALEQTIDAEKPRVRVAIERLTVHTLDGTMRACPQVVLALAITNEGHVSDVDGWRAIISRSDGKFQIGEQGLEPFMELIEMSNIAWGSRSPDSVEYAVQHQYYWGRSQQVLQHSTVSVGRGPIEKRFFFGTIPLGNPTESDLRAVRVYFYDFQRVEGESEPPQAIHYGRLDLRQVPF